MQFGVSHKTLIVFARLFSVILIYHSVKSIDGDPNPPPYPYCNSFDPTDNCTRSLTTYHISNTKTSAENASYFCQRQGGALAHFINEDESANLTAEYGNETVYIGFTTVPYINWRPNYIGVYNNSGTMVCLSKGADEKFVVKDCDAEERFWCKSYNGTIMAPEEERSYVKAVQDGSDDICGYRFEAGVNDPAVEMDTNIAMVHSPDFPAFLDRFLPVDTELDCCVTIKTKQANVIINFQNFTIWCEYGHVAIKWIWPTTSETKKFCEHPYASPPSGYERPETITKMSVEEMQVQLYVANTGEQSNNNLAFLLEVNATQA